jgi:hypothetical protein
MHLLSDHFFAIWLYASSGDSSPTIFRFLLRALDGAYSEGMHCQAFPQTHQFWQALHTGTKHKFAGSTEIKTKK